MSNFLSRPLWDRVGILATTACALHCLLMPLLLPLFMVSGLAALADRRFEWAVLALTLTLAGLVLWQGYRYHHGRRLPLVAAAVGALIYAARSMLAVSWEPLILILGASCVVMAHLLNRRYSRYARHAGTDH